MRVRFIIDADVDSDLAHKIENDLEVLIPAIDLSDLTLAASLGKLRVEHITFEDLEN